MYIMHFLSPCFTTRTLNLFPLCLDIDSEDLVKKSKQADQLANFLYHDSEACDKDAVVGRKTSCIVVIVFFFFFSLSMKHSLLRCERCSALPQRVMITQRQLHYSHRCSCRISILTISRVSSSILRPWTQETSEGL